MKIKEIQIKLHLQVSSPNFLIPSHFISSGLIETSKNHIHICQCYLTGQNMSLSCTFTLRTWSLHHHLHNKLFLFHNFFLKVFIFFQQPCLKISSIFTFSFLSLMVAAALQLCGVKTFSNCKPENKSYIHLLKVSMLAAW